MKSQQPASPVRPVNPPDNKHDGSLDARAAEARAQARAAASPAASSAVPPADVPSDITREVLALLRRLGEEPPKPSPVKRLLSHPMTIVLVTFVLTGLLGGYLTNKYTLRQQEIDRQHNLSQQEMVRQHNLNQQEIARQRSFTDELNKIRVQKIGEVWEHIDRTELDLDVLLDRANTGQHSGGSDMDDIVKLVEAEVALVNKNRFWLGEKNYDRIRNYLDINGRYALDKLLGEPGIDLTETARKREQAKQDVLQIRNMFLKGELEP